MKRIIKLLIFAGLFFTMILPAGANQVKAFRYHLGPDSIRVVMEMGSEPEYSWWITQNPPAIHLVLYRTVQGKESDAKISGNDDLLTSVDSSPKNFYVQYLRFNLKYRLPPDAVNIWKHKEPDRLVIDLNRAYSISGSWRLTPRVIWNRTEQATSKLGYLMINSLMVKPSDGTGIIGVGLAKGNTQSREKTSDIVKNEGALAGVNGGFFNSAGGPAGLIIKDGRLLSPPASRRPARTSFGITDDKKVLMDRIGIKDNKLFCIESRDWSKINMAMGGGPRLLRDGKVCLTTDAEELGKNGNNITRRAPRTAFGIMPDGQFLMLTVNGYDNGRKEGMLLEELAEYLKNLGVKDAMGLDGGTSTTMVVQGEVVSLGRGIPKAETKVADALLVFDEDVLKAPFTIKIEPPDDAITASPGASMKFNITVADVLGRPVEDDTAVFLDSDMGRVATVVGTKNGKAAFTLDDIGAAGLYHVTATCGTAVGQSCISVLPGEPQKLAANISEAGKDGDYMVELLLCDAAFNPVPSRLMLIEPVEGKGKPDKAEITTGSDGTAGFTWLGGESGDVFNVTVGNGVVMRCVVSPGVTELPIVSGDADGAK
ncbi:MAG: phosphodiester glycosidase family protein [Chloroflexi bacterium]|nr:phosphodiester glycosidase family protein [Chloroflexota bacterium]